MPVEHQLWEVGDPPRRLNSTTLATERSLHRMIETSPELLSPDWLIIGSEQAAVGGRFDLLALAPDASVVLVELKRDRTPREVVAQALDYASWVEQLTADELASIYDQFRPGHELAADFRERFGVPLEEDELNNSHQIVLVAAELDASTERIVNYLGDHGISINVLFFQVFADGDRQLISRAWLVDPSETQTVAAGTRSSKKEPWNGEFYVNFGAEDAGLSWEDARNYGFIAAGGGDWYSKTLNLLSPGARVWVRIPGKGYVGVGVVTGARYPARDFTVDVDGRPQPLIDLPTEGVYNRRMDDDEQCEYFVAVRWCQTVAEAEAVHQLGFFGNQNTVAQPRARSWRSTVEDLKAVFPSWNCT